MSHSFFFNTRPPSHLSFLNDVFVKENMTHYWPLTEEEKEKMLEAWGLLSKQYERFKFKSIETTEKQTNAITELSKLLDRKDASMLITLLKILTEEKSK